MKAIPAVLLGLLITAANGSAEQLTVDTGAPVAPGTSTTIDIILDNTANTAGAAFTVTYDTDNLTLTDVTSGFFDLIEATQVDSITYDQALVHNVVDGTGAMITGARMTEGDGPAQTIVTLHFDVGVSASGQYTIGIQQSIISNTDAGYSAGGEPISMLVGIDEGGPDPYPAVFPEPAVVSADLTISGSAGDFDGDGIDDAWEIAHFGNTDVANATSDFDGDGYSDLQESINGGIYDPKVINEPGGAGYVNNNPDSFLVDYLGLGMFTYDSSNGYTQINSIDQDLTTMADIDGDGVKEIITYFGGYGLFYYKNGGWNIITNLAPTQSVGFDGGVAVYFDGYGLYTYNTSNGWTHINTLDVSQITPADIDSDGREELVCVFPGYGVYAYGDGSWTAINTLVPENIVKFGHGLAVDFGQPYGLFTYNSNAGYTHITTIDADGMLEADIDSDGIMELIVSFPGYGLFYYDIDNGWTMLTNLQPDTMLQYNRGIAVEFSPYGLFTYNSADSWTQINSIEVTSAVEADLDADGVCELVVYFTGYGIYIWNGSTWTLNNSLLPGPDLLMSENLRP